MRVLSIAANPSSVMSGRTWPSLESFIASETVSPGDTVRTGG